MKRKILQSGWPTPVDHHLRPFSTTSSPSTTAVAAMLVASEEATSGSVIVKALRSRASSSGSSQRRRWASVPYRSSTSMFPVSGALQLKTCGASAERPVSSAIGAYSVLVSPSPPSVPKRAAYSPAYALGRKRFQSPSARALACRSAMTGSGVHRAPGSLPSRSAARSRWYCGSTGSISAVMNDLTRSLRSAARGDGEKSIGHSRGPVSPGAPGSLGTGTRSADESGTMTKTLSAAVLTVLALLSSCGGGGGASGSGDDARASQSIL